MKQRREIAGSADESRDGPVSASDQAAAASDHNQEKSHSLGRISLFGAAGAMVVALMGLLAYVPGLRLLGSIREDYIPMAPSTAVSFIVLGSILLAMVRRSLSNASLVIFGVLAALVSLFGGLEVTGHLIGRGLNFEHTLVPAAGHLGEVPIARMSPATGALFFLAGLAVLALVLRRRLPYRWGRYLGHFGGSLGSLVLGIGLPFCLAYIYGSPLLYGQGSTIPMALTTALAFLMLAVATMGASGKNAVPMSLLASVVRACEHLTAQARIILLALIMVGACTVAVSVTMIMLYRNEINDNRRRLLETARSHASLIEAVARYDVKASEAMRNERLDYDPTAATLSQVFDAHERYEGFGEIGETGEFTLARRDGDSIVFVLQHRHNVGEDPEPVPFDSELAEPMRRALKGQSGTMIGLDYRGKTVLAAHEPVAELNLGIVAKIDMSEVREPFFRSGLIAATVSILVVMLGTAVFFRISNPIIHQLETYSQGLEEEIKERRRAQTVLRESEERFRTLAATVPVGVYQTDLEGNCVYTNQKWREMAGLSEKEALGRGWARALHPDDRDEVLKNWRSTAESEGDWGFEYRLQTPEGETSWVFAQAVPVRDADGEIVGHIGANADITERKNAEARLQQSEALRVEAEKLAATGRMAARVAHEINNPLAGIKSAFAAVRDAVPADHPAHRFVGPIDREIDRIAEIVRQMLQLHRQHQEAICDVDVANTVNDLVAMIEPRCREKGIRIEGHAEGAPIVKGVPEGALRQVIYNLVLNAADASHQGGVVKVSAAVSEGELRIEVSDMGSGIPAEIKDQVFLPFFSTKTGDKETGGVGFGLAISKGIVDSLQGVLDFESEPGKGTRFRVLIPVQRK